MALTRSPRKRDAKGRYLPAQAVPEDPQLENLDISGNGEGQPPRTPSDDYLALIKVSREVAEYMISRNYELPKPWQAPLIKTPEPGDYADTRCWFEPSRVDKVLRSFSFLTHTKGKWAGRPLTPDEWQIAYVIAPVFGWVMTSEDDPDEIVRVIRECWVEVSRKNGKSTLTGGLGIYMTCADGEQGVEAVAAASTRDQARFVFDPVIALAKHSPGLKKYVKAYTNKIIHLATSSVFQVIANVADAQHGANIHFGCVDEVHIHKDPALIETIETGTGSRSQPLIFLITTADEGKPDTVYVRKRNLITSIAKGTIRKATTYGVIWAAAESEEDALERGVDLYSDEALMAANPGYGISPTRSYLREQASLAKQSPLDRSKYLRLHLGIRTKQAVTYITLDAWARNTGLVHRPDFAGRRAFGGLDLASTQDFIAWCLLFPNFQPDRPNTMDGTFSAMWRFWVPEASYRSLVKRTAGNVEVWKRQGWLSITDGDVADYEEIQTAILDDAKTYKIQEIGYDPWNATQLTVNLARVLGANKLTEVRQGYASLSSPLKELKRLIYQGTPEKPTLAHGGNPVATWMLGNLAVASDPAGNVKLDRKSSNDKIDGIAALLMAYARALPQASVRESVYNSRGLMVAK